MPKCIYCRRTTSDTEDLAHVFPEAVVGNDFTLPRGSVCGQCNRYLGHELDATLVQYPAVAIYIQFAALPGKTGLTREMLGGISLTKNEGGKNDLRMALTDHTIRLTEDGRHIVSWIVAPTRAFDMRRFRRALHHVAFNAVAWRHGAEYALAAQFDLIRNYVRRPRPREAWPFAEATIDSNTPPQLGVVWPHQGNESVARIHVGITTFLVALDQRQDLKELSEAARFQFIDESVRAPHPAGLTYEESEPSTRAG